MTNTASAPQIGGLVARRLNKKGDPTHEFVAHRPTHQIESVIASRTVTRCGREMEERAANGRGLVYWPQGVRQVAGCRQCNPPPANDPVEEEGPTEDPVDESDAPGNVGEI